MFLNAKDEKIINIFNRLIKDKAAVVDNRVAMDLSRHKVIRNLRRNSNFFIANDRNKHKSVIFCTIKIKKKGNKFFFEF